MIRLADLLADKIGSTRLPGPWQRFRQRLGRLGAALASRGVDAESEILGVFAPGRIELVGKHTDYGGGRSLTAGTSQGLLLLAARRDDDRCCLHDLGRQQNTEFRIEPDLELGQSHWPLYPRTVARRLARDFSRQLGGALCVFDNDLPAASGLSGSSVLVIAVFLTLARFNRIYDLPQFQSEIRTREDLGSYVGAIESGRRFGSLAGDCGVGTTGGAQDHVAILCSQAGLLKQFSYLPTRLERQIVMPDGLVFAVGTSGVRAEKTGSAKVQYNRASGLLSCVLEAWNRSTGRSDASLGAVLEAGEEEVAKVEGILRVEPGGEFSCEDLLARWRHFRTESEEIVPWAGDALENGDLATFGALVDRSQALAEGLLGNQIPETVFLARQARRLGAMAASAFGAGFGGAVWALVQEDRIERFLESWRLSHQSRFPNLAELSDFIHTEAGEGALEL